MSWIAAMLMALLSFSAGAYAAVAVRRGEALRARIAVLERREGELLEISRALSSAARRSSADVLDTLDRTMRSLERGLDTTLVFTPSGGDLVCTFAAGDRAMPFLGARFSRESASLAALAALHGCRAESREGIAPIVPTDRAALAMPMVSADGLAAVVYVGSLGTFLGADRLVSTIAQAAPAYCVAAEREAERMAVTFDALTGLHTPRAFRDVLAREIGRAETPPRMTALWFVDTDHFKSVNDTFGHSTGDRVLQRMAALLREGLGIADLPARNGGDEFCAILRDVSKIGAIERAQSLCDAVRSCDFGEGIRLTASIGVACFPNDARDAGELLEAADAAMYHSKRSGRDRVSFAISPGAYSVYRE